MESMIERVARTIYEKRNGHGCKPWSIQPKAHKAPYLDDAIAAIKTMREPSEHMVDAAEYQHEYVYKRERIRSEYAAMIDAALTEKAQK